MSHSEAQPDLGQRQFLKKLAGTAAGVAGFAAASRILNPPTVEAAYSAGTAPDGGDLVNTHLWIQGNETIQGPRPWIDVRAYGALGDGSTDDTTAIQNAFNAIAFPGGQIFFPAGIYRVTAPITCSNKSVHVVGAGRGFAALLWDSGVSGGLQFSFNQTWNRLTLHSLGLVTQATNGGVAIQASWPTWSGGEPSSPHIYDVIIVSQGGGYWTKGIELTNASGARIRDFDIAGYLTPQNMTHGIHLINHSSSIVNIHTGHILYAGIGVLTVNSEGVYISDVEAVVSNIGFYLDAPEDFRPGSAISNCHTSGFQKGIYLYQHNDMAITGNLIYEQAAEQDNNWIGIDCVHSPYTRIIGNNLHGGTNTRNGIVLGGSSSNCTIQGNVVRAMNTGIWLAGGGTDDNVVVGNRIQVPTVTAILNSGTGNLIANNL